MSELPSNWSITRIGEVADINPRSMKNELDDDTLASFVPMKCVEAETGRFTSPENKRVGEVKIGYTPMRDGDVIVAKVTPCMENGKGAVVRGLTNGIGFGSTEFYALRPKDNLMSEFLFYYIIQQGFRREAERHMTGAVGLRRVPRAFIEEHDIPLPPLPEQRRIVARIEELFSRLDAGVAALRHAKAQLQRYRQAVLAAAVTGQLTQAWREQHPSTEPAEEVIERILAERRVQWEGKGKYKEPKTPNPVEPIPLPTGWCLASPEHIATHIVDCPHSTPKWTPTGEICLRTTNFLPGRMILDEVRYVSPATYNERIARLEPQPGDVLYSREGGILGLACIIPNGLKACLGQRMMQFRIDADIALPEFFNFVLNSPMILSEVKRMTGGSASPHLNIGDIRAFPIPLPPLAEQHQIVAEVEARTTAIDHLEAELDRQITRSNRLRQSALASAFCGKL